MGKQQISLLIENMSTITLIRMLYQKAFIMVQNGALIPFGMMQVKNQI